MALYEMVSLAVAGDSPLLAFIMIGRTLDAPHAPFEMNDTARLAVGVALHFITAGFWSRRYKILSEILPAYQDVLVGYAYKDGKSYAEYRQGDKLAQNGLTATVARHCRSHLSIFNL